MYMTTTQHVDYTTCTIAVRISRRWWSEFMSETIVEDALGIKPGETDHLLIATKALIDTVRASTRRTKQFIEAHLDLFELQTLIEHADWFAYYWGDEQAGMATTFGDAGAWASKGRASRRLCDSASALYDDLSGALGMDDGDEM
jgi:hypothetical protein